MSCESRQVTFYCACHIRAVSVLDCHGSFARPSGWLLVVFFSQIAFAQLPLVPGVYPVDSGSGVDEPHERVKSELEMGAQYQCTCDDLPNTIFRMKEP